MGSVKAEFLKLRRSMSWAVVIALPLMAVITGIANTLASGGPLEDGWHTLWLRVVVFYGLFPQAVGLAALGSLVWRAEHQPGNWNALMGRSISSTEIVLSKAVVLVVLAAAMQVVLLAGTVAAGKLLFELPGLIPTQYLLVSVVVVIACVPVAVLQSALSMSMRSFAGPVAVALLGAVLSIGVLLTKVTAAIVVVPYALLGRATQLGTGVFSDDGYVSPGLIAMMVAAAAVVSAATVWASARRLDRRDVTG